MEAIELLKPELTWKSDCLFRAPHSMLGGGIRPVSVTTISSSQVNLLWNFHSPIHKASVNMILRCLVICIFLLMKRKGQVFQVQLLYWQLNTPACVCHTM